ncbi:hypothetical protein V8E55_004959 [Tylopilus felleus]
MSSDRCRTKVQLWCLGTSLIIVIHETQGISSWSFYRLTSRSIRGSSVTSCQSGHAICSQGILMPLFPSVPVGICDTPCLLFPLRLLIALDDMPNAPGCVRGKEVGGNDSDANGVGDQMRDRSRSQFTLPILLPTSR